MDRWTESPIITLYGDNNKFQTQIRTLTERHRHTNIQWVIWREEKGRQPLPLIHTDTHTVYLSTTKMQRCEFNGWAHFWVVSSLLSIEIADCKQFKVCLNLKLLWLLLLLLLLLLYAEMFFRGRLIKKHIHFLLKRR